MKQSIKRNNANLLNLLVAGMFLFASFGCGNFVKDFKKGFQDGYEKGKGTTPNPAAGAASGETKPCSAESNLVVPTGQTKAEIDFDNQSGSDISVYWINLAGKRQKYFDLAPGKRQTQSTFLGHWWLVTDKSGKCLSIYSAPQSVTITE